MAKYAEHKGKEQQMAVIGDERFEILYVSRRQNVIEVSSSLPEPLPSWKKVDSNGHHHKFVDGEGYPTLETIAHSYEVECECGMNHIIRYTYTTICRLCGEEVMPETYIPSYRKMIAGALEITVTILGEMNAEKALGSLGGEPGWFYREKVIREAGKKTETRAAFVPLKSSSNA